jgi:hypothetical protein
MKMVVAGRAVAYLMAVFTAKMNPASSAALLVVGWFGVGV